MRSKNSGRAIGDLVQFLDKHRAKGLQPIDHMGVVHDFVAHVDRGAESLERLLDNGDSAFDSGAKTARGGEDNAQINGGMVCVKQGGQAPLC